MQAGRVGLLRAVGDTRALGVGVLGSRLSKVSLIHITDWKF